jgi:RecA/RadA recombinase
MAAKKKAAPAVAASKEAKKADRAEKRAKVAPKRPEGQLTRVQTAQAVMAEMNVKYGGDAIFTDTSDLDLVYLTRRVPTGITSLDAELHGGFPCAGISQLIGRRNCGKTYLYWRAIAELQKLLGSRLSVMLAMNEMHADISQARLAGVAIRYSEDMIAEFARARHKNGMPPFTPAELADMRHQIGNFHEVVAFSGEDLYQAVYDGVYENAYHFIAIDSIGNVMSGQEADNESFHDKTRGGAAAVNTQFIHKILPTLMTRAPNGTIRDTCIVVVNQIRDDQKNPDAPYKNTGGHSLEHAKFVDIFLSPGPTIGKEEKIRVTSGEVRTKREFWGKEVNWEIKKGKAGIHEGARGTWSYYFNDERSPVWCRDNVDIYSDAILYAADNHVLEQNGAWYSLSDPADPKKVIFRACGLGAAAQELYDDDMARRAVGDPNTLLKQIRDRVFHQKGINLTYEWGF